MSIIVYLFSILFTYFSYSMCTEKTYVEQLEHITTKPFHVDRWLQTDIYKSANKIIIRDLTSIPTLSSNLKYTEKFKNNIEFDIFYDCILDGVYLDQKSNIITSVIDVGNFSLENADIFDMLWLQDEFSSINFPLISDLFNNIKIRQHRLGGIALAQYSPFKQMSLFVQLPVLYQIHHVHTDEETKEKITDELSALLVNNSDSRFLEEHFASDMVGIDRPKLGATFTKAFNFPVSLEVFSLLPIGFEFKEGIIGGQFNKVHSKESAFSLQSFLKEISDEDSTKKDLEKDKFADLLGIMLKRLTASSFYSPFSKKNLSIGACATTMIPIDRSGEVATSIKCTYTPPHREIRYGYSKSNKSSFDKNYATENEAEAKSILLFFDQQFLNRVLLVPYSAEISGSWDINANVALVSNSEDMSAKLGFDIWYKSSEKIQNLDLPNITHSNGLFAAQGAIFSEIKFIKDWWKHNWNLGCNLHFTVFSDGIGKEHIVSAFIKVDF